MSATGDYHYWQFGGIGANAQDALRTIVTRRELEELDDRALADVGISRSDAVHEARRAPWDLERPGRGGRQAPSAARSRMGPWIRELVRRYRSRQAIAELDGRMLKDIGVSYAEAEFEANKAFWQR